MTVRDRDGSRAAGGFPGQIQPRLVSRHLFAEAEPVLHRDAGTLQVWLLRTPDHTPDLRSGRRILDEEERERADAFVRDADRERYLASHIVLRRLLGAYLNQGPARVAFLREPCPLCSGPHGRPAVAHGAAPPVHFSLAHSGDLALLAFYGSPVGIDVEAFPDRGTVGDVEAGLHPRERAEIAALASGGTNVTGS
ncbi:hypothetical protein ABZW18_05020 [Streptomyces sp. NPDC004647]|uniref:4'-phosphopantetheinyl transferase family protein n=1 Tax=Streptomyces sp. NPDC004647 TaxID=3154671 RepID=UPI0033BDA195